MSEEKMFDKLEAARLESMNERHPIYAFSNGQDIRYYPSYNAKKLRPYLESIGYWVAAIFENGHRVEA